MQPGRQVRLAGRNAREAKKQSRHTGNENRLQRKGMAPLAGKQAKKGRQVRQESKAESQDWQVGSGSGEAYKGVGRQVKKARQAAKGGRRER
jgi:hypothetical protein